MEPTTTFEFARAARLLTTAARSRGLLAPGFRCPPRLVGVDRSIRRHSTGAQISIRVRGRPTAAVVADMIEGVIVTNQLRPPEADQLRAALWCDLSESLVESTGIATPEANATAAHTTPVRRVA